MNQNNNFGFVAPMNLILFAKTAPGATWGYGGYGGKWRSYIPLPNLSQVFDLNIPL
jgi:hypothetical protein